jgi:hypothetical protein
MRNVNSHFSVVAPAGLAWWRSSWTGRIILAALLIAASAIALMPDRTSAHHTTGTTYATHCQSRDDVDENRNPGSLLSNLANSEEFVEDCIALLKAAGKLTVGDDTRINWMIETKPDLPILDAPSMTESPWHGVWIDQVGEAPNQEYRITRVDLSDADLSGELAPEWAELTALTSLNLSGNRLGKNDNGMAVPLPLSVQTFLDNLKAVNLDGNRDLLPSAPLQLSAAATKTAGGEPKVTLSFDNIWYTLEVSKHEYRYSVNGGSTWGPDNATGSGGWMTAATGCTDPPDSAATPSIDPGAPVLCDKDDGGTPPVRNRSSIESGALPKSDTYVFQVRAVKSTPYDSDEDGDTDADDTPAVTRSEVSQIDVVGPQTLTAESDFLLELGVTYTVTDPMPDAAVLVVESRDNGLQFTPKAPTGGNDVSVTLTQPAADVTDSQGVVIGHAGGSLSFPVDIKPASGAPTTVNIPNQSILRGGQPTRLNLASLFQREDLTYTATSSRENFATVEIDQVTQELVITTLRAGVTVITVTATDVNRGKATDTFRLTVVSPNKPPEVVGNVPDQTLFLDDAGTQLDMTPYFRDGDGDLLRFIPQSSNPRVVTASSSGGAITFNVISLGEVRMTVLAEDPEGVTAFVTFTVTVLPPNIAPEAVGEIPAQTLRLGDPAMALNLAPFFTDADGDPLTFTAGTADGSILTVDIAGSVVTMTAVAAGETTMTVTATDPRGESAMQEVAVTALPANRPPEAVGSIGRQVLVEGGNPMNIDVAEYFNDPDGDALTYTAESSSTRAVWAEIADGSSTLALTPLAHAEGVTVTVTAMDGDGESVMQAFIVTVAAASGPAIPTPTTMPGTVATPTPTQMPAPTSSPESPASPEPTSGPEATATPPPDEGGGFPVGLFLVLLLVVAGIGAAVFIIQRRGSTGPPAQPI